MTAWSGFVKGFESTSKPLTSLTTYTSNDWLSDVHLGQMTELLSAELYNDHIHTAKTLVISPYFTTLFLHNEWTHPWTQQVAEDLTTGRCVCILCVLNVNNNHWITYVIDFHEEVLLFGNSLGHYPDKSVINVFLAWIKNMSGKDFQSERLTTAIQTDSFSCGMLAVNALEHHMYPQIIPLLDTA